jgi:hypothetical protein
MNMLGLSSSVRIAHTVCYVFLLNYTQDLCQYGLCKAELSESESELLYDWRFTANQFALALILESHAQYFFPQNTCGYSPYVISSLTRGWVCRLQLLLALASAVILGSESRRTHDHMLQSHIRDSPNLEGQVPVFISPRNKVSQL